jgi:hypothetical protein
LRFTKEQDGAKRKGKIAAPIHFINGIANAPFDRSSRAALLP